MKELPTLHILSNPTGPVRQDNRLDAFAVACWKFIKYMTSYGWNCVHYGCTGSDVLCEEVSCLDIITDDHANNVTTYNLRAGIEINKRKKPGDIIVCFYGQENQAACLANPDLKAVEGSIGYTHEAVWAPYRIFVSYSHMHIYYGKQGMSLNPSWYDTVIYNPISKDEFDYCEDKDDYFLVFGRVTKLKGIDLAIQATEYMGKKLVIAGAGTLEYMGYDKVPKHVEMIGTCNLDQRRKIMSKAKAILGLTYYVEPFGNMIAEGFMSGTPAITTDWGAFIETVNPKVGFRCRDFRDVIKAIENIDTIKPIDCRQHALNNFEDEVIHPQFDEYFKKLATDNFYRT